MVDNVGNGIEGVKIEIDDMERATTDSQVYYKLIKAKLHLVLLFLH